MEESHGEPFCCSAEGEIYNEKNPIIEAERVEDAINLIVPKEREYPAEYNENYFQWNYEDTFRKRSIEEVLKPRK